MDFGKYYAAWLEKRLEKNKESIKYILNKVVVPLIYKWECRKPIQEDKVIFMEVRLPNISNSLQLIYNDLMKNYDMDIHSHFLRTGFLKRPDVAHRTIDMARDMATAKYIVYDEGSIAVGGLKKRKGQKILQTWHGCGAFKKFGWSTADSLFGDDAAGKKKYPTYSDYDMVTVSSPDVCWAYEEAMAKEGKGCVQPIGVSRTDVFFDEKFIAAAHEHVRNLIPDLGDKKIILYAPTFRGRVSSSTTPDMLSIKKFYENFKDEYVLIFKHHPVVKTKPEIPAAYSDFAFDFTNDLTIEELLCVSDICISDYSSLVFEYSLFEKPMIFFSYDLVNYFDWRGFYYDYHELAPGPVCMTNNQMIDYIKNIDERFDKQQIIDFKNKFMSSCDGHSTERIIDKFFGTEIEKFRRSTPLEDADYSAIPNSRTRYSTKLAMYGNFAEMKAMIRKAYDQSASKPVDSNKVALVREAVASKDIFYSLRAELKRRKIQYKEFGPAKTDMVSKAGEWLGQCSAIIVAGDPTLLRMLDIRKETKLVQVQTEVIPMFKKGAMSLESRTGINRDVENCVPFKTAFDAIIMPGESCDKERLNYHTRGKAEYPVLGHISSDVLFNEAYCQKAKDKLAELIPASKNKKIIVMMSKYRESNGRIPKLYKLYEDFIDDHFILYDCYGGGSENDSVVDEYLAGFAVAMHMQEKRLSPLEILACADIVIADYQMEAYMPALLNKPVFVWAADRLAYLPQQDMWYDFEEVVSIPSFEIGEEDKLIDAIREAKVLPEQKEFMERYFTHCDGHVAERLVDYLYQ